MAMPRRRERTRVAVLVATLLASLAGAEPGKEAPKGGTLFDAGSFGNRKEPITITADTLEYDYKTNVVVYRGEVVEVTTSRGRVRCGGGDRGVSRRSPARTRCPHFRAIS